MGFWKEEDERGALERFLVPKLDLAFWVRLLLLLSVGTILVVRFVATPAFTNGASMVPTYGERQFVVIWHPVYWYRRPRVGEVVAVRYIGEKVMFFKRVVATEGQAVEFRHGRLFVDGEESPYYWNRLTPCDWRLPPRLVPPGHRLAPDHRRRPRDGQPLHHLRRIHDLPGRRRPPQRRHRHIPR